MESLMRWLYYQPLSCLTDFPVKIFGMESNKEMKCQHLKKLPPTVLSNSTQERVNMLISLLWHSENNPIRLSEGSAIIASNYSITLHAPLRKLHNFQVCGGYWWNIGLCVFGIYPMFIGPRLETFDDLPESINTLVGKNWNKHSHRGIDAL